MKTKAAKNHPVNCQVCGTEVNSYQVRPGKLGHVVVDLCSICLARTEVYENFKEAVNYLNNFRKKGQDIDFQLDSPNVVIKPIQPAVQKAVQLLQRMDPSYFKGVREIAVGSGPAYGHVESGEGKDPNVINVNLQRIISEAGGKPTGREVVIAAALVIAHEKGHLNKFNPESGFAGEGEANAEENRVLQWIKSNESRLQDLFS